MFTPVVDIDQLANARLSYHYFPVRRRNGLRRRTPVPDGNGRRERLVLQVEVGSGFLKTVFCFLRTVYPETSYGYLGVKTYI